MKYKELCREKLHQCGLNSLSMELSSDNQYIIFTGADDQSISISLWNINDGNISIIKTIKEAHSSSIRATKLIKIKEGFLGLSSGYDQRLIVWKIHIEGKVQIEKLEEHIHGIPDIAAICASKDKDEEWSVYIAGDGLEILKLHY